MKPEASKGFAELRSRLFFLAGALIVFRLGVHIPVPGVDYPRLREFFSQDAGLLDYFNLFTGGALQNASIMALGIFPYITASIVMMLASYSFPALEAMRKEGASGRRKITRITRYIAAPLTLFQAYGIAIALESFDVVPDPGAAFRMTTMVCVMGGSMYLMWLGEQISERGIGNGISLLIFASIVSGLPPALGQLFSQVRDGQSGPLSVIGVFVAAAAILGAVVFIERGQRRILLNYAKRQVGGRLYGGQASYLPFKVNMAGVMPAIFAYAIITFPATFLTFSDSIWMRDIAAVMQRGTPMYFVVLGAAIVFFAFFFVSLTHNPQESADNLRKSGAFIPGIRPGDQTSRYLEKIILRLTLFGASYIAVVCLIPEIFYQQAGFAQAFGGTSILIMVVVAIDFMEHVQYYMLTQQYGSLLKKSPVLGRQGSG